MKTLKDLSSWFDAQTLGFRLSIIWLILFITGSTILAVKGVYVFWAVDIIFVFVVTVVSLINLITELGG